jgi:hypothetical protein
MSTSTYPTSAPLEKQLDTLRQELAAERASTDRATFLTTVVGVIVLLLVSGFFFYGYREIARATEPQQLVDAAEGLLDQQLPEVRTSLERKITDSAPQWAVSLSRQALAALPDVRKQAETLVLDQLTSQLNEADLMTDEHFRTFLKENRPLIEARLKELADHPKLAEESTKELEEAIDRHFQSDMKQQAKALFKGMASLTQRMKWLYADKNLTPEGQAERRVVLLARRLQKEQVDPALTGELPAPETPVRPKPPADPGSKKGLEKKGTTPPAKKTEAPSVKKVETPKEKN